MVEELGSVSGATSSLPRESLFVLSHVAQELTYTGSTLMKSSGILSQQNISVLTELKLILSYN